MVNKKMVRKSSTEGILGKHFTSLKFTRRELEVIVAAIECVTCGDIDRKCGAGAIQTISEVFSYMQQAILEADFNEPILP